MGELLMDNLIVIIIDSIYPINDTGTDLIPIVTEYA
ncbi:Uncharacterised protein [Corynebacterium matruchotii]|jgi:hypothetical protein|uniref:Uncharacterized protein n=1 Tax=Corynebacterium matruchotii TaxID=43768 RepID=A0A8B4H2W1_9CORY|nr:Uncharacterised protein [Corynebacterium matruchotii]VEI98712.1 Uncharacterised protein [Corynebacterium matruchotii]